jgi:hypothetical protein
MHFARLALMALAFTPAAAIASVSADQVLAEAAKLPLHVPGQYRMSIELIEADGAAQTKVLTELMRSEGKESLQNSDSCADPSQAETSAGVHLVREILEDNCEFERFTVSGENVSAIVQCPADGGMAGRIKMNGRIGADSLDVLMTIEQTLPDKGTTRMQIRTRSERVGECAA